MSKLLFKYIAGHFKYTTVFDGDSKSSIYIFDFNITYAGCYIHNVRCFF